MSSYIHMMIQLFNFILMMVVIFAVILGCCALVWHVLVRVYNRLRPYGLADDKEMQRDLETASIFLGLVLAGVLIVPPVLVFGPKYTEDPETVKAQKASEDAAFAEGQLAAENGIPCEACPHGFNKQRYSVTATAEYSAWMRGWTAKTIELKKGRAQ